MITPVVLMLLARIALVRADIGPTTPSPGDIYNEGSDCEVAWTADTTGVWKTVNIELMTGSNDAMQFLKTVGTVDGTDSSNHSYTYPCPSVTPNAPIYFYQFTSPYTTTLKWTGRFAIATANGSTTAATETTTEDGETVPWGTGALVDDTNTETAPPYGESVSAVSSATGSSSVTAGASVSTSESASASSSDSSTSVVGTSSAESASPTLSASPSRISSISRASASPSVVVSTDTATSSSASSTAKSASAATNAAPAALKVDHQVFRASVALSLAALTFAIAL